MNDTSTTTTNTEPTSPRFADNVPGPWYVNEDCISCLLCSELAPENFRLSDDGDHNIVYKQPSCLEELELCEEALDSCPVESIVCEDR